MNIQILPSLKSIGHQGGCGGRKIYIYGSNFLFVIPETVTLSQIQQNLWSYGVSQGKKPIAFASDRTPRVNLGKGLLMECVRNLHEIPTELGKVILSM